eukprot:TRINITY_DN123760_c0_g1_i1.p1 TRINITY_DN123760_c0_g1~~TRINITY_DN123760_c0_g1_i1.p1  ORF type:complete len:493 (+),score=68.81 TRINITY_DN123760_c0_g1_i1:83-1561(+)
MVCRCLCKCCGVGCFLLALLSVSLFIPAVFKSYWLALEMHLGPSVLEHNGPTPSSIAYALAMIVGQVPLLPEYGAFFVEGAVRNGKVPGAVNVYGGPGLHLFTSASGGFTLYRASHEAARRVYADKTTDRSMIFIGVVNVSESKTGKYYAPGVMPTLLQRGTSDPMWWAIRDLWSATIPALQRYPAKTVNVEVPPNIQLAKFCDAVMKWDENWSGLLSGDPAKFVPDELAYVVSYNFWREVFGVTPTKEEMDAQLELNSHVGMMNVNNDISDEFAARGRVVQKILEDMVLRGETAAAFLDEAAKRGLDGPGLLRQTIFSFTVAGASAPGTSFYVMHAFTYFQRDKKLMAVYKNDKEAFLLEVVRTMGAGGGNSYYHVQEDTTHTLGSGKVITEKKGTVGVTSLIVASYDPSVWGGPANDPEYAAKFIPGRENRERLLSFMSELGDIRKCPNMTGCDAAPRFCPGAELTQRLTRQIVDLYFEKCPAAASQDEL